MRHPRLRGLPVAVALTLTSPVALAQPTPPEPTSPSPDPRGGDDSRPLEDPEATPPAPPTPPPIDIADPLLRPVDRPPHVVPTFAHALALISTRSTELTIASAEATRAEGMWRQALGRALPIVTATGSVSHQLIRTEGRTFDIDSGSFVTETVPSSPTALAQLSVSQPILALRTWHAVGTADRAIEGSQLGVEDQRRRLVAATANAIVGVVTAERVAEINRSSLRAALERLELTQRQRRLGTGNKLDVVRAEQDVALARANVIGGDETLFQAREALGLTLGSSEPHGVPPSIELGGLEAAARAACDPGPVDARADVRAARLSVELAERGVTDADLMYAPTADVSSTFTVSSETLANQKQYGWSVQGVLTVPIWDGGVRYGARKAAEADVLREQATLDGVRRAAQLEANQSTRAVAVAERAREVAVMSRDLAKETERLSRLAFEKGVGTSFDLVEAGRRLREAELELVLREFDVVEGRIASLLAASTCKY